MTPPIVRLSVACATGVWAGQLAAAGNPLSLLALFPLIAVVFRRIRRGSVACACAVALGASIGVQHAAETRRTCHARWEAGPRTATVMIHDRPGPRGATDATVLSTVRCDGRVWLRVPDVTLPAGATAVVVGRYHTRGVLRVRHLRVLERPRPLRFVVRDVVAQRIRSLYGRRAGLVEALVLGRRHDIEPDIRRRFIDGGVAHLLAISGLHVGLIAGWLQLLFRLVGLRRVAWIGSAAVTWVYVALLGFPPSANRAAWFVTLYGMARARGRNPPFPVVISVAVFGVLLIDPGAAIAVGAWLSVAAVWGTHHATQIVGRVARRLAPVRLFTASVGATLFTAPITAFAFGTVAPVGVLTNLVAVPLAGLAVPGVFASLVLGSLLAGGAGLTLAGIEYAATLAATVPAGHLNGTPGLRYAAPWAAALVLLIWLARSRPRWPIAIRRVAAACAVTSWATLAWVTGSRGATTDLTIFVLDVGQGDAIAVRTPKGQWVVVDGGPRTPGYDAGERVVLPFLRRRGARHIAAAIVSHGDADHLGGIPAVVQAFDPGLVLEPGQPLGTDLYLEYLAAVDRAGIRWRAARAGDRLVIDSVHFEVLHPTDWWLDRRVKANENSIVVRLSYGCFDAVLTGDVGAPAESLLVKTWARGDDHIEVLKVGHHGSRGGTGAEWLDFVRPRIAVISVGRNRFGHPSPEVVARLRGRGIPIYRTDEGGTVTIRSDGRYLQVEQRSVLTPVERLRCLLRPWLPSSDSSWSRSGCILPQPVSLPICSTT